MAEGARKVAMSFGWVAIANYSNRVLGFLTLLILAKLLPPETFGALGVAQMLINMLYIMKDMGISQALIYKKDRVDEAASTGFLLVTGINTLLFLIALALSPMVGKFYDDPTLAPVVAVLSFNLVWIGLMSVPEALVRKGIDFHKLVIPSILPVVVASVTGIAMAYAGHGVWSLVVRSLIVHILGTILIWRIARFRPGFRFDPQLAKELFSYGKYIIGASIVLVALFNVDKLYVSKLDSIAALGFYTLAMRIADLPVTELSFIICRVMFPVMSKINQDLEKLQQTFLRMMRYSGLISIPMSFGIATYGPALITAVYGDRWAPMGVPLQILAAYALFRSVSSLINETFKAIGKPNLVQRYAVVRLAIILPLGIPATMWLGVNAMCGLMVAAYALALVVELLAVSRLLSLSVGRILRCFSFPILISLLLIPGSYAMLAAARLQNRLTFLVLGVVVVIALYFVAIAIFKRAVIADIKRTLTSKA